MAGVNKWIGIGNLTRDPEVKEIASGNMVKFGLACNERWGGEDHVEFVNIVVFGKLADICSQYLAKGKQVYVEGKLSTSSWDKDGEKRYRTEVIARDMVMLGSKNDKPQAEEEDVPPF